MSESDRVRIGLLGELLTFTVRLASSVLVTLYMDGPGLRHPPYLVIVVGTGYVAFPWAYLATWRIDAQELRYGSLWTWRWRWSDVRGLMLGFVSTSVGEAAGTSKAVLYAFSDAEQLEASARRHAPSGSVVYQHRMPEWFRRWNRYLEQGYWARFSAQVAAWVLFTVCMLQALVIGGYLGATQLWAAGAVSVWGYLLFGFGFLRLRSRLSRAV